MCAPMLMAVGAIAGGVMQAAGAVQAGNAQARQYEVQAQESEANAALKRRQAVIELTTEQQKQRRQQEKLQQQIGLQINQYAAAGVSMEGTPTDIVLDTTREATLDIQALEWNAQLKAGNFEYGAKIDDMNAANARAAAKDAKKTGRINAMTGLFGSVTKLAGGFGM